MQALLSDRGAIRTGPFGSLLKKHEHRPSGVPVLGIENIGDLKFLPGPKIHIAEAKAGELADYDAKPGDILISRSGTVGRPCVIPDGLGEARISTNVIRVRVDQGKVSSHFLAFCVAGAPAVLEQMQQLCGGSTREFLNQAILNSLIFPLPPFAEQHEIVRRVDALFKFDDTIERRVAAATARADKLTQAILAKAFRGELVPTEAELARREGRGYEPAAVLLERIRAERAVRELSSRPSPKGRGRRRTEKTHRITAS